MKTNVKCPNCKTEFELDEILLSQFKDDVIKDLSENLEQKIREENLLKFREKEKVISDMTLKINELKQKAEQGSIQLQGQVQELELVEILKEFHYDKVTQSKTGTNAADVLQIVCTPNGAECGKIYYESKRTKTWSNDWIPKFKQDNLNTSADILVLVTNTLPKEIKRYGLIDGVWICRLSDVAELSLVLRYAIFKVQSVIIKQENKESKAELLYNYLSSEEFNNTFQSILDGFKDIQESHEAEKKRTLLFWKDREKQITKIISGCIEFTGTIKNTVGITVPEINPEYRKAG
jgi:hypothetical protein